MKRRPTVPASVRLVFSTESSGVCTRCGWPQRDCRCAKTLAAADTNQAVTGKLVANLRLEKKGRAGKVVTVVDGLPRNASLLAEVAAELRRACATGGTTTDSTIELQGDHRDRVRSLLANRGWRVKG